LPAKSSASQPTVPASSASRSVCDIAGSTRLNPARSGALTNRRRSGATASGIDTTMTITASAIAHAGESAPTPQPAAIQTRPASGQTMPGTLTYASATMATSAISRNSTTMSMPPIGPHRTTRTSPIGRRASSGHPRFALELALDLREIGKWSFQPREQERCETPEEDFVVRRLVRVDGLTRAELGDELQRVGTGERVGERAHDEVQPPRELLLRKLGERARERGLETRDHRRVLFGKESADERRGVRIRASEKAQEV